MKTRSISAKKCKRTSPSVRKNYRGVHSSDWSNHHEQKEPKNTPEFHFVIKVKLVIGIHSQVAVLPGAGSFLACHARGPAASLYGYISIRTCNRYLETCNLVE
jgi:hypothetical protein